MRYWNVYNSKDLRGLEFVSFVHAAINSPIIKIERLFKNNIVFFLNHYQPYQNEARQIFSTIPYNRMRVSFIQDIGWESVTMHPIDAELYDVWNRIEHLCGAPVGGFLNPTVLPLTNRINPNHWVLYKDQEHGSVPILQYSLYLCNKPEIIFSCVLITLEGFVYFYLRNLTSKSDRKRAHAVFDRCAKENFNEVRSGVFKSNNKISQLMLHSLSIDEEVQGPPNYFQEHTYSKIFLQKPMHGILNFSSQELKLTTIDESCVQSIIAEDCNIRGHGGNFQLIM